MIHEPSFPSKTANPNPGNSQVSSRLPGFYELPIGQRRDIISSMAKLDELMANPQRFLQQRAASMGKETPEWVALALIKLAANDHQRGVDDEG
mgnify:CR=1 FL=1